MREGDLRGEGSDRLVRKERERKWQVVKITNSQLFEWKLRQCWALCWWTLRQAHYLYTKLLRIARWKAPSCRACRSYEWDSGGRERVRSTSEERENFKIESERFLGLTFTLLTTLIICFDSKALRHRFKMDRWRLALVCINLVQIPVEEEGRKEQKAMLNLKQEMNIRGKSESRGSEGGMEMELSSHSVLPNC